MSAFKDSGSLSQPKIATLPGPWSARLHRHLMGLDTRSASALIFERLQIIKTTPSSASSSGVNTTPASSAGSAL
ncbi:hypothetical protein [Streptosporangium sp. OZ121]|uniref:hypothetical protein n=1 Tax=Streptosporangium sp. OZ121 TaxID=3444183 RepID=UPI003F7A8583